MTLERLLLKDLLAWKRQPTRKPLLVDGARQVGKSYLLEVLFGQAHFRTVFKLDFLQTPELANLFAGSLAPAQILQNLEIHFNANIDPAIDLLFFDEIGECQGAVDSLKYFAEQLPEAYVCASGSNIGLLDSFPVGKVHQLELLPQIEFLYKASDGSIVPVEVKSGSRTRAKSLAAYVARYAPARTVKLVGTAGGTAEGASLVWPLYYARFLATL